MPATDEERILAKIAKKRGHAVRLVQERPKTDISRIVQMNPHLRARSHSIYHHVLNTTLYHPETDIKLGDRETISLSENGLENIVLSSESYNSFMLFSHLAMHLEDSKVLFIGEPGTGKTQTPITLAYFNYGLPEDQIKRAIIRGHPEISTSSSLVRTDIPQLIRGIEILHPRPFMKSLVRIVDEANRIPAEKLSLFYEIADTGQFTFNGQTFSTPPGPLYMTANYKDNGNSGLAPPFIDRADLILRASALNPFYYQLIQERTKRNAPQPLSATELFQIRGAIGQVKWEPDANQMLAYFMNELNACTLGSKRTEHQNKGNTEIVKPGSACDECRYKSDENICQYTENGISQRMYQAIDKFSRALTWFTGREAVDEEIVSIVVPHSLGKKLKQTRNVSEQALKNDYVSFAENLWEKSVASYEKNSMKVPIIRDLCRTVSDIYQEKPSLSNQQIRAGLADLQKMDTPSKMLYASLLADLEVRTR